MRKSFSSNWDICYHQKDNDIPNKRGRMSKSASAWEFKAPDGRTFSDKTKAMRYDAHLKAQHQVCTRSVGCVELGLHAVCRISLEEMRSAFPDEWRINFSELNRWSFVSPTGRKFRSKREALDYIDRLKTADEACTRTEGCVIVGKHPNCRISVEQMRTFFPDEWTIEFGGKSNWTFVAPDGKAFISKAHALDYLARQDEPDVPCTRKEGCCFKGKHQYCRITVEHMQSFFPEGWDIKYNEKTKWLLIAPDGKRYSEKAKALEHVRRSMNLSTEGGTCTKMAGCVEPGVHNWCRISVEAMRRKFPADWVIDFDPKTRWSFDSPDGRKFESKTTALDHAKRMCKRTVGCSVLGWHAECKISVVRMPGDVVAMELLRGLCREAAPDQHVAAADLQVAASNQRVAAADQRCGITAPAPAP
jgi:hypothetical protein